jgi:hypothetical protein
VDSSRAWLFPWAFVACHRGASLPGPTHIDSGAPPQVVDAGKDGTTTDEPDLQFGPEFRSALRGGTTILELSTTGKQSRLDGPSPKTVVTLRKVDASGAPADVLGTWRDSAQWKLSGYSSALSLYTLIVFGVSGAWWGIVDVVTISESGAYKQNLVPHGFFGVAEVLSPDGAKVAFVAKLHVNDFRLLVFDVATSTLADVGPAPAPAPYGPDSMACEGRSSFGWVDPAGIAGYRELEPGIVQFSEGALVVSYGADTCARRARQRHVRTFPLSTALRRTGSKSPMDDDFK